MEKFIVLAETNTYVRKFRLYGKHFTFKFTQPPPNISELDWIKDGVEDLATFIKKDCGPSDQVGFTFISDNFRSDPGWYSFRPCTEIKATDIWDIIYSLMQSNSRDISPTDALTIKVTRVQIPAGTGRRPKMFYNTYEEECIARSGIVQISNDDNLCLARAIVVAKAFAKKHPLYKNIRKDTNKIQTEKAAKLLKKSGVCVPEEGGGIHELLQLQKYLKKYKITVYNYEGKGRSVIFEGGDNNAQYRIHLLHHNHHYNVITSLTSAFATSYYCEECHISFKNKLQHRCVQTCRSCHTTPPCRREGKIVCNECNRTFYGGVCFENHQTAGICDKIKKCVTCLKTMHMDLHKTEHSCGEVFCKICDQFMPQGHLCYMKKDNQTAAKHKNYLYVYYDFETQQDMEHPEHPQSTVHVPNMCVFQQSCDTCIGDDSLNRCSKCGVRQTVLVDNIIDKFLLYVFNLKKVFKTVCCIAHNAQSFDVQFIMKYIVEKTDIKPSKLIMRGTRIILLQVANVRFIDSLNYFPMALSKLPKAFGLNSSVKKGYFPHFFNTKANENYIGPVPEVQYYGADSMFEEDRKNFLEWHQQQKEAIFNFKNELREYCVSDVNILRQACESFRTSFISLCNTEPFLDGMTIASACNTAFRRKFIKPDTIGLIPYGGYRWKDNQSQVAIRWLLEVEKREGIKIIHAAKGPEEIVMGTRVDGFCRETNQVFEFHGCYYHACPRCFPHNRDIPVHDDPSQTLNLRYERTQAKIERLKGAGYGVIEMWECQYKRENDLDTDTILQTAPLDPRGAFFGGRTDCTKLYYKATGNETIKYLDVCSLYPWVCKTGKYPLGHPKIYVGKDCASLLGTDVNNISAIEGLIKCSVVPPSNLYHPVLPVKQNDKLMFVLCRTCGEKLNNEKCKHSPEERALRGTWVADELRKAVSVGYKILEVFEIWQYEVTKYNPQTQSGGLFTTFINTFLKVKQEASGYPSHCTTEQDKNNYIEQYAQVEGVKLDRALVANNPGLRSMAKLILNSFWGRFGLKDNLPRTSVVREPKDLLLLLTQPAYVVNTIQEINEEVLLVNWVENSDVTILNSTTNVVIAAYTTAQARLKLYEYLECLGQQVLYYDTDSVIFYHRDGLQDLPSGCFLGDLTDELEVYGPGSFISEFVSGGPKTYAYKVKTPGKPEQEVCKVKGLTLNHRTSKLINFDALKRLVFLENGGNKEKEVVLVMSKNIKRRRGFEIVTAIDEKMFKVSANKRRRTSTWDTEPYGFR